MNIIFIYYYLVWKYILSGKKEGEKSIIEKKIKRNLSLVFKISDRYKIHIHHWLYLTFLLKKYKKNKHIKNLCWSGIVNGLMYQDSFNILLRNTINENFFLKKIKD